MWIVGVSLVDAGVAVVVVVARGDAVVRAKERVEELCKGEQRLE